MLFTSISLTDILLLLDFANLGILYQFIFPFHKMKFLFLTVLCTSFLILPQVQISFCTFRYIPSTSSSQTLLAQSLCVCHLVCFLFVRLFFISAILLSTRIFLYYPSRNSLVSIGFPVSWIACLPVFWCTPSFCWTTSSSSFIRRDA